MNVKRCDRKGCNKFYEQYGHNNPNDVEPNGAMLIFRGINGAYNSSKTYDLCPECLEKLKEFLGGEDSETNSN